MSKKAIYFCQGAMSTASGLSLLNDGLSLYPGVVFISSLLYMLVDYISTGTGNEAKS